MRVVIFEADTPAGKRFDIALLVTIFLSVSVVMAESVGTIRDRYGLELKMAEWTFTLLFTAEYVLRLMAARTPGGYARSFFGVVDLLAILPTYLGLLFPGAESLLVIRGLRLLRVFRVFKLARFLGEALKAVLVAGAAVSCSVGGAGAGPRPLGRPGRPAVAQWRFRLHRAHRDDAEPLRPPCPGPGGARRVDPRVPGQEMPGKEECQHHGVMTVTGEFYPEMEEAVKDLSARLYDVAISSQVRGKTR